MIVRKLKVLHLITKTEIFPKNSLSKFDNKNKLGLESMNHDNQKILINLKVSKLNDFHHGTLYFLL